MIDSQSDETVTRDVGGGKEYVGGQIIFDK